MRRAFFESKLHRATVTHADLDYEGSVTIDAALMEAARIAELEEREASAHVPTVVLVTSDNRLTARGVVEVAGPARRAS